MRRAVHVAWRVLALLAVLLVGLVYLGAVVPLLPLWAVAAGGLFWGLVLARVLLGRRAAAGQLGGQRREATP